MSKDPRRIFLDWKRPLLEQAAELLMAAAPSGGRLDLGETLAIVPTRNAARRLREMLANLAAERGAAVIPPLCGPPTLLVRPEDGAARIGRPLASSAEVLAAWIAVLRDGKPGGYPHLFPIEPALRDFAWARGMAHDLVEVRSVLGEAGLLMADVARRLAEDHDEKDRWSDLGKIEEEYLAMLRDLQRCDPVAARSVAADHGGLPEGTSKIVLLGTADPFPLARRALERLAEEEQVEITVVVYAPPNHEAGFDDWGQPLADYWTSDQAPIEIDDFAGSVQVLANPDHLNESVVETVNDCAAPEETLAIGALDSAAAPIMERALRDHGIPGFAPEGRLLRSEGLLYFLEVLRDYASRPRPEVAAALLRTPEIDAWLATRIAPWQQAVALRGIDDGLANHLADDSERLADFLGRDAERAECSTPPRDYLVGRYRMAAAGLDELTTLRSRLAQGDLSSALPEVLREILSCRSSLAASASADGALLRQADVWPERVLEVAGPELLRHLDDLSKAAVAGVGVKLTRAEQMTLAIGLLSQARLSAERPPAALELQGWLELLWEDAPHLVVAGLNDGIVPEAVVGHPFLPESLRSLEVLGLKGNAERFARDAYQLTALLESRRQGGRVDLLLVRRSQGGDPMRPSRLLLCCHDEDLPARVRHLFRDVETSGTSASWDAGFQLCPGATREVDDADDDGEAIHRFQPPPTTTLSVTGFRRYLDSPFHFYMDRVLRSQTVETARGELGAMEFGIFCHNVLEAFGCDEKARDLEDAAAIEKYLMGEAEHLATQRFGVSPALAVRVQLQAARQRLQAVARVQAEERQQGWQIVEAELDLKKVASLVIDGVTVSGRIDRVEKRDGVTRVIDYKTSDKAKTPRETHYKGVVGGVDYAHLPDYACFELEDSKGKAQSKRWTDLQLPLYCLALQQTHGETIEAGYLMMPKATSETRVETLIIDDPIKAAALRCAEGIIADVIAGRFWPLVPQGDWDNYEGLHLGVPDLTIDAGHIGGSRKGESQ